MRSMSIYLGHNCWAKAIAKIFPDCTDNELLIYYLFLTVCSVLLIHVVSKYLRWVIENKWIRIRAIFINTGGRDIGPRLR